jgi:hypothetical protein
LDLCQREKKLRERSEEAAAAALQSAANSMQMYQANGEQACNVAGSGTVGSSVKMLAPESESCVVGLSHVSEGDEDDDTAAVEAMYAAAEVDTFSHVSSGKGELEESHEACLKRVPLREDCGDQDVCDMDDDDCAHTPGSKSNSPSAHAPPSNDPQTQTKLAMYLRAVPNAHCGAHLNDSASFKGANRSPQGAQPGMECGEEEQVRDTCGRPALVSSDSSRSTGSRDTHGSKVHSYTPLKAGQTDASGTYTLPTPTTSVHRDELKHKLAEMMRLKEEVEASNVRLQEQLEMHAKTSQDSDEVRGCMLACCGGARRILVSILTADEATLMGITYILKYMATHAALGTKKGASCDWKYHTCMHAHKHTESYATHAAPRTKQGASCNCAAPGTRLGRALFPVRSHAGLCMHVKCSTSML